MTELRVNLLTNLLGKINPNGIMKLNYSITTEKTVLNTLMGTKHSNLSLNQTYLHFFCCVASPALPCWPCLAGLGKAGDVTRSKAGNVRQGRRREARPASRHEARPATRRRPCLGRQGKARRARPGRQRLGGNATRETEI